MSPTLDPEREALTAFDKPLFSGLPGDIDASFEFFPPKTEKMEAKLWDAVQELKPLNPSFVSVTYGAGGSTRERTHNTVARIIKEAQMPAAAHLTGQYGVDDLYVGVPVIIGKDGVEKVIEIELSEEAQKNFDVSVDAVKELLEACKGLDESLK